MTVDSEQKLSRREVHYDSFDDLLDDAERLAAGRYQQIGNWSLGPILKHLATAMDGSIDGMPLKVPWFLKLLRPVIKPRFLKGPFPSGFQLNKEAAAVLVADPSTTVREGMDAVREGWSVLGPELMPAWVGEQPGTRPWAWWQFDAPDERRRRPDKCEWAETEAEYLDRHDLWWPGEREQLQHDAGEAVPA